MEKEELYEMLPAQALKSLVEELDLEAKKNSREDMKAKLQQKGVEKETLRDKFETFKKENTPVQFFLIKIEDNKNLKNVASDLKKAKMNDNKVQEEGFEITDLKEKKVLKGKYWTYDKEQEINSFGEFETKRTDKSTAFKIDLDADLVYVSGHQFATAKGIANKLRDAGIDTGRIGHKTLLKDQAKEKTDSFVEELKNKLEKIEDN